LIGSVLRGVRARARSRGADRWGGGETTDVASAPDSAPNQDNPSTLH
jgi:hypothetical protein